MCLSGKPGRTTDKALRSPRRRRAIAARLATPASNNPIVHDDSGTLPELLARMSAPVEALKLVMVASGKLTKKELF